MLFNSIQYAIFLPIVFALYWLLARLGRRWQNILLLVASYYFYGSWDLRFLGLLAFSTVLDYFCGIRVGAEPREKNRKIWLWISLIINLGFLGVFKYYDFFATSFQVMLKELGSDVSIHTLQIILPVGISFYTFHGISYILDVYNRRVAVERNLIDYALFVSFFPLLVAGPIERATHLLPQLKTERIFNTSGATDGLRQILWGLFKKMVIADICGRYVNYVFDGSVTYTTGSYWLGAIFFTIQIYADFSGYSDIAIGSARLLGIDLFQNFKYPLFATSITDFWKRWHLSLSSWFRDYLYIPLGGNRRGSLKTIRNILIVFLISGLWHGANWTFLVWGLIHGLLFIAERFMLKKKDAKNVKTAVQHKWKKVVSGMYTVGWVTLAFIFFRSESLSAAFQYIGRIITFNSNDAAELPESEDLWKIILLALGMFMVEWRGRSQGFALAHLNQRLSGVIRYSAYYVLIFLILYFSSRPLKFVYFQF